MTVMLVGAVLLAGCASTDPAAWKAVTTEEDAKRAAITYCKSAKKPVAGVAFTATPNGGTATTTAAEGTSMSFAACMAAQGYVRVD